MIKIFDNDSKLFLFLSTLTSDIFIPVSKEIRRHINRTVKLQRAFLN